MCDERHRRTRSIVDRRDRRMGRATTYRPNALIEPSTTVAPPSSYGVIWVLVQRVVPSATHSTHQPYQNLNHLSNFESCARPLAVWWMMDDVWSMIHHPRDNFRVVEKTCSKRPTSITLSFGTPKGSASENGCYTFRSIPQT